MCFNHKTMGFRKTMSYGWSQVINASNMASMIKKLNERPREGSNTKDESAADIQEQSGDSRSN